MKKLIALIVLIAAGGAGYWYYQKYGKPEIKPQVTEGTITRGSIAESVQATGTLDALKTVQIGTQVSGVVRALHVDFNSIVKKGDLIAELDPTLLQTQVEMQEANLNRSQIDLNRLKVSMENDQRKLDRARELFAKNLITKEAMESAELQVKLDQAQIDSSNASLVQTRANLSQAQTNLSYTKIYAPIDGVITVRNADVGQTVNATNTAPTLYTMATDLTTMKLTASIDEADVARVRAGQTVSFRVDSYAGSNFRGTVRQVRLNAKNSQNVVTYETVIDVMNPDLRLKPGMTANLTIEIQRVDDVLRVPAAALRFRPTAEFFELLKQPVPPEAQPNQGRGGMGGRTGGRNGGEAGAAAPAAGAPAAAPGAASPATRDAAAARGTTTTGGQRQRGDTTEGAPQGMGRTSQGGGENPFSGGRGQGGGQSGRSGFGGMNLTPAQQKQLDAIRNNPNLTQEQRRAEMGKIFGAGDFGGGRGQGGRTGGRNAGSPSAGPGIAARGAETIDELLPPVQRREMPNQRVWVFVNNQLKPVNALRTGISDGQFTELVTGDLKEGDKVVTNFVIPGAKPAMATPQQGNPFQQQGGRGGPGGGFGGGGRGGF